MAARLAWCHERAGRNWRGDKRVVYCDLDESYFQCVTGAVIRVHVDDNTPIRHVRNHLHPPKVMVVALVCAPSERYGRNIFIDIGGGASFYEPECGINYLSVL